MACEFSSQILAYQKMVGQLQDVGNTTTIAHYLRLLDGAGLCTALQKFDGSKHRLRSSIPKLQVWNTALISAQSERSFDEARADSEYWGRLVESAVGAHLMSMAVREDGELFYWRDGNDEVDFIYKKGGHLIGFEVKSGRGARNSFKSFERFKRKFENGIGSEAKMFVVGPDGIPLEEFFLREPSHWM